MLNTNRTLVLLTKDESQHLSLFTQSLSVVECD